MLQEMLNDEQKLGRFGRKKGTLQEGKNMSKSQKQVRASWVWGYKGLGGAGTRPVGHGLGGAVIFQGTFCQGGSFQRLRGGGKIKKEVPRRVNENTKQDKL